MSQKELYHHGILGQKWGVKNGPPYPLNSSKNPDKKPSLFTRLLNLQLRVDDWWTRDIKLEFENWVYQKLGDTRMEEVMEKYDNMDWVEKYMFRRHYF